MGSERKGVVVKCSVELRCDTCQNVYKVEDAGPNWFGVQPGDKPVSISRPCTKCGTVNVTVLSMSVTVEVRPAEDEWPEFVG